MRQVTLKDAIYGLAVADAVGVPFEFMQRGSFNATDMTGYGTHNQAPGTWSDDTSMTLATCHSIKKKGCIDTTDIMKQFRSWLHDAEFTPDGDVFDVGGTTASAINQGYGLSDERSNGNGSLMRIIPLAFIPDVTNEQIEAVSAITHAHKISKEACIIYVKIAKELMQGKSIMDAVKTCVSSDSFYKKLISIDESSEDEIKSSGYVVDTIEAAIWAVATTDCYKDAVLKSVNLGSDTDTVAAVAGALAGIIYGYDAIPEKWINTLKSKTLIDSCLF